MHKHRYPQTMGDEIIAMSDNPGEGPSRFSLNQRARSVNDVTFTGFDPSRPNRVVSGFKKLNRAYFTVSRVGNWETHVNGIVEKLEENSDLMQDTPVSEEKRKEALRELPQCLTMKRFVKAKLTKSVSQKSKRKPIGFWKRNKYRISLSFNKFIYNLKNFNYFELWHKSLKDIEGRFGSGYASYFKFLRWLFLMNILLSIVSFSFVVLPQVIYDTAENTNTESEVFKIENIFLGDGFFKNTILYYSHYTNKTIEPIPYLFFSMPTAYFSVFAILYILQFVVLAVSVAQLYRRTYIETEGGFNNVYANRVFCGWDFGIATKEAAHLKSLSIYNELKELLSEDIKDNSHVTCLVKFWTLSIQFVVNILILVLLAAVGWLTWVMLENEHTPLTAIVTNLIVMIFPSIFSYISKYEDYKSPRTALSITLFRTYLLGSVILGTIFAFWLKSKKDCWEDHLASEIYRLLIFDFLFSVILSPVLDFCIFIGNYLLHRDPKTEFNVAKHTLQIIYNEGLFWVGFYFSPLLAILVTIKMFIIWYVRWICVSKLCKPPKRTWRAAQTQTVFMMAIFLTVLLVIAVQGYVLTSVPALKCGPFSSYENPYQILNNALKDLEENAFLRVILNVFKPGGVALIMIGLIIFVYYSSRQASASKEKVKMLKETLVWIAKDKKCLVQWYNDLVKDEINLYFGGDRFVDPGRVLPNQFQSTQASADFVDEDELYSRYKKFS